jgi:hypothetical protein
VIEVVETIGVRTLLETQKAPFYMNDTIPNKPVINNLLQHDFSGPGFKVLGVMWEMISMGLSNILLHVFYDEFQSEDYPKRKTLMPQPLRRRGANGA